MGVPEIPQLFEDAPLKEIVLPFKHQRISLLAVKDACALRSETDPAYDIYWGELWPAAVALADAIFSGAIRIPERGSVLEVGCGTGLISLALALKGGPSLRAVASDREYRALRLTEENARRHGVAGKISTQKLDWREPCAEKHALILAGDCLYQADACWQLATFLRDALADVEGACAYVVDPHRWSARNFGLMSQQAGLNVEAFRRVVPFVTSDGPIRESPVEARTPAAQPIEANFYKLTLQKI